MRCLHFDGKVASPAERPAPRAAGGIAVLRVRVAGVCNTDLEIVRGYLGFEGVLGHEFVGEVVDGPAAFLDAHRGRRMVGEINFACGRCGTCRRGLGRHCPHRTVMGIKGADGAFAEYVAVPTANLHPVPDALDDEQAAFTEPLAAAFEILEQVSIEPGQRCTVLGDGKLGLLAAQVLHGAGARVLVVGRHPSKLELLATRGIEVQALDRWVAASPALADVVVEATGSAEGFQLALGATAPRGKLVLKSTVAESPRVDLAPLVIHEIEVIGSRCGPFEPALAALAGGEVEVAALICDRFPLARADEALRAASKRGALKVLIDCS